MKSFRTEFDTIVLGAGFGGLASAALLALYGHDVLVLEGHTTVGGCAGYFDRFEKDERGDRLRYRFDVGATTLSGVVTGRSFDRLFSLLGDAPVLRRVDPGMVVWLPDGRKLVRWSDTDRWIRACEECFGQRGQREFWGRIMGIADRGWELSRVNPTFPPKSLRDILGMVRPVNLRNLDLLSATRRSVMDLVRECGLDDNALFRQFLAEQLMITAQNVPEDTPLLVGAMGLAYPNETWYAEGGMYGVAGFLETKIRENGGEVRTKRKVGTIEREGDRWALVTQRETYRARRVISNSTVWDMAGLVRGEYSRYFGEQVRRSGRGWGAFTVYCAVSDSFDDAGSLYHQIHCDPLPHSGSRSIFVSLSPVNDGLRAPEGWRVLTVSTHLADPDVWERLAAQSPDLYEKRKEELGRTILELVSARLPGFSTAQKKFVLTGTPRTFGFYTRRMHGMVGGIPHSLQRNLVFAPKHRTPLPEMYMVGDTVYPGQGVAAVVLGALNLVAEL